MLRGTILQPSFYLPAGSSTIRPRFGWLTLTGCWNCGVKDKDICGHLAPTVVSIGEYQEKVWATINLAKVRFYLFRISLGKLTKMTVIFVASLTIVSQF